MARMPIRAARPRLALGIAALLLLPACSSEEDPEPTGAESAGASTPAETSGSTDPASATASEDAEPYLPVPDGTELTPGGAELGLGDPATVAWSLKKDDVAVADLTVLRVDRARIKALSEFKLDKRTRASTPYYVRARVANVGETGLAGSLPPLYVEDEQGRLIAVTRFRSSFEPCSSTPLPKGLKPGETFTGCWVYLVPEDGGTLTAVSYYPVEGVDPIDWTGKVTRPGQG
jgi:hypothetical protein